MKRTITLFTILSTLLIIHSNKIDDAITLRDCDMNSLRRINEKDNIKAYEVRLLKCNLSGLDDIVFPDYVSKLKIAGSEISIASLKSLLLNHIHRSKGDLEINLEEANLVYKKDHYLSDFYKSFLKIRQNTESQLKFKFSILFNKDMFSNVSFEVFSYLINQLSFITIKNELSINSEKMSRYTKQIENINNKVKLQWLENNTSLEDFIIMKPLLLFLNYDKKNIEFEFIIKFNFEREDLYNMLYDIITTNRNFISNIKLVNQQGNNTIFLKNLSIFIQNSTSLRVIDLSELRISMKDNFFSYFHYGYVSQNSSIKELLVNITIDEADQPNDDIFNFFYFFHRINKLDVKLTCIDKAKHRLYMKSLFATSLFTLSNLEEFKLSIEEPSEEITELLTNLKINDNKIYTSSNEDNSKIHFQSKASISNFLRYMTNSE